MLDSLLTARPGGHFRGASGGFDDEDMPDRGVNFPMFLTMMGEHLYDFDTEQELLEAFECFDENDSGFVKCDEIRKWLGDVGERMDQKEVRGDACCLDSHPTRASPQIDKLLKGPFTDRQGNFNYREWVKVLRINADNEEPETPL